MLLCPVFKLLEAPIFWTIWCYFLEDCFLCVPGLSINNGQNGQPPYSCQADALSKHQYGNFVVQHLYEHAPNEREKILKKIIGQVAKTTFLSKEVP